jgi:hypothetical protein
VLHADIGVLPLGLQLHGTHHHPLQVAAQHLGRHTGGFEGVGTAQCGTGFADWGRVDARRHPGSAHHGEARVRAGVQSSGWHKEPEEPELGAKHGAAPRRLVRTCADSPDTRGWDRMNESARSSSRVASEPALDTMRRARPLGCSCPGAAHKMQLVCLLGMPLSRMGLAPAGP